MDKAAVKPVPNLFRHRALVPHEILFSNKPQRAAGKTKSFTGKITVAFSEKTLCYSVVKNNRLIEDKIIRRLYRNRSHASVELFVECVA